MTRTKKFDRLSFGNKAMRRNMKKNRFPRKRSGKNPDYVFIASYSPLRNFFRFAASTRCALKYSCMSWGLTDEIMDYIDLVIDDFDLDDSESDDLSEVSHTCSSRDGRYGWFSSGHAPHDHVCTMDDFEDSMGEDWGEDWSEYADIEEAEVEVEGEVFLLVSIRCEDDLGLPEDAWSYVRAHAPHALEVFRARGWPQRACALRAIIEI